MTPMLSSGRANNQTYMKNLELMSQDELLRHCMQEENSLTFDYFNREDALRIGLKLNEKARAYPDAVSIEITLNGLVVFRYFPEGTMPDNGLWMQRKRNTVDLMHMSSLRFMAWLEVNGWDLTDRKLDAREYVACGGGFPINIRGTGTVGSICVSGLPHFQDHQLIVDTLTELYC